MEKINPAMLTTEDLSKIYEPAECFFCKLPLTSDDFKLDRVEVEETKNFIAHSDCVTKAICKNYGLRT